MDPEREAAMRLTCPNCGATYGLAAETLPPGGGHVQCSACHTRWFARPEGPAPVALSEDQIIARLDGRAAGPRLVTSEPGARPVPAGPSPPAIEDRSGPTRASGVAMDDAATPPPQAVAPSPAQDAAPPPPQAVAPSPQAVAPRPQMVAPPVATRAAPSFEAGAPLRPRHATERAAPAPPPGPAVAARAAGGGARRMAGFCVGLVLAVAALAAYLRADEIATRFPAARPTLAAYTAAVDAARASIEARLGPARDRLAGG